MVSSGENDWLHAEQNASSAPSPLAPGGPADTTVRSSELSTRA
jgi:hypothetical protein